MHKKILLIEDDVNILYGLQAKFSSEGFEVFTSQGIETIEDLRRIIKDYKINYIILDIILPKFDGFTVLHEIKADHAITKLPVFIFSNLSDKDTKEKCERLGAENFFVKEDFVLDDFVEKIKKIINNREKNKL
jgi:DNA-binding response OmpR family regulator